MSGQECETLKGAVLYLQAHVASGLNLNSRRVIIIPEEAFQLSVKTIANACLEAKENNS